MEIKAPLLEALLQYTKKKHNSFTYAWPQRWEGVSPGIFG